MNKLEGSVSKVPEVSTTKEPSFQSPPVKNASFGTALFFALFGSGVSLIIASIVSNYVLPLLSYQEPAIQEVLSIPMLSAIDLKNLCLYVLALALLAYYVFGKNKPYWMNIKNISSKTSVSAIWIITLCAMVSIFGVMLSMISGIKEAQTDMLTSFVRYQVYQDSFNNAYMQYDKADQTYTLVKQSPGSEICQRMDASIKTYVNYPLTNNIDAVLRRQFVSFGMMSGCLSSKEAYDMSTALYQRVNKIRFGFEPVLEFVIPKMKEATQSVKEATLYSQVGWCSDLMGAQSRDKGLFKQCNSLSTDRLTSFPAQKTASEYIKAVKESS